MTAGDTKERSQADECLVAEVNPKLAQRIEPGDVDLQKIADEFHAGQPKEYLGDHALGRMAVYQLRHERHGRAR